MNADFVQGLVGGVLAGFLVLAPIVARLFGATTKSAPDWLRPQADPELLTVAREILADREYLRIGKGQFGDLEIVAEYDNPGGEPSLCIRTFTLRRDSFERDDWEFVDNVKSQGGTK